MSYIKDALLGANPHKKLKEESQHLVNKWEKTGLLEGLDGDYEKSGMSIMLENQAKQLIDEANATGTYANSEEWAGVALPLVRRIFAEIAAQDFVSVQPMNLPSGLVFYLDFKYGNNVAGKTTTESVYGKTGPFSPLDTASNQSSPYPEGGLYGAGAYGFTQPSSSIAFGTPVVTEPSLADLNYDTDFSASNAGTLYKVAAPSTIAVVRADQQSVRAYQLYLNSGLVSGSYPNFTKATFNSAGSATALSFIVKSTADDLTNVEAAMSADLDGTITYLTQPTDITRGDFEAAHTTGTDPEEANLNIPEINLELKSRTIVAKTRKLKAVWTPEMAQDLNAYHSIDAEAELTSMLSEYISMEIDLEIIDMLLQDATTTEYWSARVGYEWDGTSSFSASQHATNALAYQKNTWYQTLGQKIQKVSNKIHQLTLRGGANFLVVSPSVATLIESIPGFAPDTDGTKDQFSMGVSKIGALSNRWQVYKNPYITENQILIGFRGNNFLETGAVYAPYIPLIMTPLVYDPTNFTPRKGVMTRYAKKMVRPEYYGKIYVHGLETV